METVAEILENISSPLPHFAASFVHPQRELRRYFNIFINRVHIRPGWYTNRCKEEDKINIMASAAGGRYK